MRSSLRSIYAANSSPEVDLIHSRIHSCNHASPNHLYDFYCALN